MGSKERSKDIGTQKFNLRALILAMRPKQWIKNLLVLTAPAAAGVLSHLVPMGKAIFATIAFCLISSATYLVNDVLDLHEDRLHPKKKERPIAKGIVTPPIAIVTACILFVAGGAIATAVAGLKLEIVVELYVLISITYSLWLKHSPVIEMASLSSGFVLRAIAGGVATNVPLSIWFIVVTSFGALLVVAGKRSAEHHELGDKASAHRKVLDSYPMTFLRSTRLLAASVTVTAYCLWAFERGGTEALVKGSHDQLWFQLSIVPFVLAILLVELALETGRGGAPEDLAFEDRTLQILGIIWIILFALGVYGWPL
ncbi:MAG: decaprenyl-phosphate phosphoribosyltransferase [Acidimicrobiales bacterium]|nr:decaprenyl-phosphate phosphoribosyltransferase [Acidimicrobiales bacterium]